jgi:DNA-binding GntR family transcriptional regulator
MQVARPARAHDRIVDDLRRRISRQGSPPGAALPSESQLAAEFSVSRGTVRAALSSLARAGLIESVPARGWYVKDPTEVRVSSAERLDAIVGELQAELSSSPRRSGERFLSEKDLGARFGLSRHAARAVLAELQSAGLIVAVHGRGRFIVGQ